MHDAHVPRCGCGCGFTLHPGMHVYLVEGVPYAQRCVRLAFLDSSDPVFDAPIPTAIREGAAAP